MFRSLQIGGADSIRNTFFVAPNWWRVERRPLFAIRTLIRTLDIPTGDSSDGTFHILNGSQKALGETPLWMAYLNANYSFNCVSFSEYQDLSLIGAQVDKGLPNKIEFRRDQIPGDVLRNPRVYSLKPTFMGGYKWVLSVKSEGPPLVTQRQYRVNLNNVFLRTIEASVYKECKTLPHTTSTPEFGLATRVEKGVIYSNGLPGYYKNRHNTCLDVYIGDFVGLYDTPIDQFHPHYGLIKFRNHAIIHLLTGFKGVYGDSPKDIKENGYSTIKCKPNEIPEVVLRNPNNYLVWEERSPATKHSIQFSYSETGGYADNGIKTLEDIAMYIKNEPHIRILPFRKKDDVRILTNG